MSLYIGKDTKGNNMLHLTKTKRVKSAMQNGSTYSDSIIGPNVPYSNADIIDLGIHVSKTVSYSYPYTHSGYKGYGQFFGPFYFRNIPGLSNSFNSVAKVLVAVTDTITNVSLMMSRSIVVHSTSDSYFYINDIVNTYHPSFSSNAKHVRLIFYGSADIPYSGPVKISLDEFTIGGVDVLATRTAIMEVNSRTNVNKMLGNNRYGESFTTSYGSCTFTIAYNLGVTDAASITNTRLELSKDKLVCRSGYDIIFNSDFAYTKAYEHTNSVLNFSGYGPFVYPPELASYGGGRTYYPTFTFNDLVPTSKAVLLHKVTFGGIFPGSVYEFGEVVYNVLIPVHGEYIFIPTNAGDIYPYYNRTMVFYKVEASAGRIRFLTNSTAMYDGISWGDSTLGQIAIKIEGYTVFN